jgi:hypothetical protein
VPAKIIHKIPACDPSGLPLGATANQKKSKAVMLQKQESEAGAWIAGFLSSFTILFFPAI